MPVIGDVDLVVRKMNETGNKKVWNNIYNAADIHSYRGDALSEMNGIDVLMGTQID